MNPRERLSALEGLRGYAAFLVFLVHAFGLLAARVYGISADLAPVLGEADPVRALVLFIFHSHYGVDLFFVLSGLLMTDLAMRRWPGARRFFARRLARIYPAYLLSAVITATITVWWFGGKVNGWQVVGNLFLLQGFFALGIVAMNPVSWSLTFEAAFYLLVPLLQRKNLRIAVIVLLASSVPMAIETPFAYFSYFSLFLPGIALGILDDERRVALARRIPTACVILAWMAFTLGVKLGFIANIQPAYYVASGIAGGLVVLKTFDDSGFLARALATPAARWLGKHSYSFFLIHFVVVHLWGDVVARLVPPGDRALYAGLFLPGALGLSLLAAWLLYAAAERFYFDRRRG